jgi:phage-related protein
LTVDELEVLITANTNELRKEMDKANKSISGLQKSAQKGASSVSSVFKKLKTGIVALGIGKVIKDSITSGMEAIESDSLFRTVMGDNEEAVRSWSDEVSKTLGLNAVAMQKNIGTIYNMTSSMGVAEDNALKMSKGISVLAEDMASFYNLDSAEAFNKLRAGITGETEPLKSLGILVDENTIKQVAYSEGIAKNGAELTQQQKVLARYVAILKQTGNAQGDLARTINSPSNQLRSLKQQVTNLGISLSKFFMPIVSAVLPWLNAMARVATDALNAISPLADKLGNFLGISNTSASEEAENISNSASNISGGLADATKNAKKLKGSLAGFDEMNVLTENKDDSAGAGGSATVGVDFDLSEYDARLDLVESSTDALVDRIKGAFSSLGKGINFTNLINAFTGLKTAIEPIAGAIWEGLKWAYDNVLQPFMAWTIEGVMPAFFDLLSGALAIVNQAIIDVQPMIMWFWDNILQPFANWTGGVIVSVLSGIGDALKWISENEIAMTIIESVGIAIGIVAGALVGYNVAMAVCNTVTGIFSGIMAVLTSPITLVVGAIAAVIAIITLCVKHWDEISAVAVQCWEAIKGAWEAVAEWFNTYVIQPVVGFFTGLWDGIKSVWNSVADWFNTNVIKPITNFFTGLWDGLKNGAKNAWDGICSVFSTVAKFFSDIFSKAWQGIVNVFSPLGEVFVNIKDGIISVFKTVVNGLITGINTVIGLPFKGLNGILDTIQNINILGVMPFGWLTWRAPVPEIPKLARGGIVDKPTYAMVGEAGKEAVMPLERNTGWIEQLADKIGEKLNGAGGGMNLVVKLGDEAIFDKFIEYGKEKSFETNGEVVFA